MSVDIRDRFRELYGKDSSGLSVAPGRVNLIGEHTDYNDGFVLPMNVERYTRVAFGLRADRLVRVWSGHVEAMVEFPLGDVPQDLPQWARYVANVAAVLVEAGLPVGGADLAIVTDVPVGGGLSSSASLESSVAAALLASAEESAGLTLDEVLERVGHSRTDLALLCQKAEHRTGAMCGIMDQYVVLNGREGQALLIDCRSLEARGVAMETGHDVAVVIINSRVHHDLAAAAYNERRQQCAAGVTYFAEELPGQGVRALRDVSLAQFDALGRELDPLIRKRVRHVITEIVRTQRGVEFLEQGQLADFGRLMNESHASLRDDYEVSTRELDLLTEIARGVKGVYGSRMTGGGFGGCTVTLCERGAVEALREAVMEAYPRQTGLEPDVLVTRPARRAHLQWPQHAEGS